MDYLPISKICMVTMVTMLQLAIVTSSEPVLQFVC